MNTDCKSVSPKNTANPSDFARLLIISLQTKQLDSRIRSLAEIISPASADSISCEIVSCLRLNNHPSSTEAISKIVRQFFDSQNAETQEQYFTLLCKEVVKIAQQIDLELFDEESISPKELFHLHASLFGSDSTLAGTSLSFSYIHFLKKILEKKKDKTVGELRLLYKLASTEIYTTGFTTHRIYIEYLPNESTGNSYLRIYNLGSGLPDRYEMVRGGKKMVPIYIEWEVEKLSPSFRTATKELLNFIDTGKTNEDDIYIRLRDMVNPVAERASSELMTIQHSGICAWRSLLALVRANLLKDDYKNLVLEIKLQSLYAFERHHINYSKAEIELIKMSARKVMYTLSKAIRNNKITRLKGEVERVRINALLERISYVKPAESEPLKVPSTASIKLPPPLSLAHEWHSVDPIQIDRFRYPELPTISYDNIANSIEGIEKQLKIIQELENNRRYEEVNIALFYLMKNFKWPLSDSVISNAQAEQLIVHLASITKSLSICQLMLGQENRLGQNVYATEKAYLIASLLINRYFCQVKLPLNPPRVGFILQLTDTYLSVPQSLTEELFKLTDEAVRTLGLYPGSYRDTHRVSHLDIFADLVKQSHLLEVEELYKNPLFKSSPLNIQNLYIALLQFTPSWMKAYCHMYLYTENCAFKSSTLLNHPPSLQIQFSVHPYDVCYSYKLEGIPELRSFRGYDFKQIRPIFNNLLMTLKSSLFPSITGGEEKIDLSLMKLGNDLHPFEVPCWHLTRQIAISTLAFFKKFPEKIQDLTYQYLFIWGILGANELSFGNSKHRSLVIKFIKTTEQRMLFLGAYQTLVFLAKVKRGIGERDSYTLLYQIVSASYTTLEEKSIAWAELAALWGTEEIKTEHVLYNFLCAYGHIRFRPPPEKWVNSETITTIQDAFKINLSSLHYFLNKTPELVNDLLHELHPENMTSQTWRVEEEGFVFRSENNEIMFDLLTCSFIFPNKKNPLPEEILNHLQFQRLFSGKVKEALASHSGHLFTFNDPNGYETIVKINNHELTIQQKRNNKWYEYISNEKMYDPSGTPLFLSRFLTETTRAFQALENPSEWIFCDSENLQEKYHALVNEQGFPSITYLDMCLTQAIEEPFELSPYTHVWKRGEEIALLEYPRLGLSFTGPKLESVQYPGFYLIDKQLIEELKNYRAYLVIQNAQGDRLVLLSGRAFKLLEETQEKESLEPRFFIDPRLQDLKTPLRVYTTDTKKHLKGLTCNDDLFLALCLAVTKNARRAGMVLRQTLNKMLDIDKDAVEILGQLLNLSSINADKGPDTSGFMSIAGAKLIQKAKASLLDVIRTEQVFNHYLDLKHHATNGKLHILEELQLLRVFARGPLIEARAKELGIAICQQKNSKPPVPVKKSNSARFLYPGLEESIPPLPFSIVRPRILISHFPFFAERIVQNKSQTMHYIRDALGFLDFYDSDGRITAVYRALLFSPSSFKNVNFKNFDQCEEIAKRITVPEKRPVDVEPLPTPHYFTPPIATVPLLNIPRPIPPIRSWKTLVLPYIEINIIKGERQGPDLAEWLEEQGLSHLKGTPQEDERVKITVTNKTELQKVLRQGQEEARKKLSQLKREIRQLANKIDTHDIEEKLTRAYIGHNFFTFSDLMVNFAINEPGRLQEKNRSLTEEDIQLIYKKIGEYLALALFEEQRNQADNLHQLIAERAYDLSEHPEFAVFEHIAKIILRHDQVEAINNLTDPKKENLAIQMIMGSGKSKVLIPLLSLLRANGERLSTLVVPSPLYNTFFQDTHKSINEAFGKILLPLSVSRQDLTSTLFLESIHDLMIYARNAKQAIVLTPESLSCLTLGYIESHLTQSDNENSVILGKILAFMHTHMEAVIDEVDSVLDVQNEVSFSIGDFSRPTFEEGTFIAKHVIKVLKNQKERTYILEEELKKLAHTIAKEEFPSLDKAKVSTYLLRKGEQEYYQAQTPKIRSRLALSAQLISHILPHTLIQKINEHYGLGNDSSGYAIPYASANTPRHGSEFVSSHVTMAYTYQYYLLKGISKEMIREKLLELKAEYIKFIEDEEIGINLALENFNKWCGIGVSILHFTEKDIENAHANVNQSPELIANFVTLNVIPKMKIPQKKITVTSLDLVEAIRLKGFTGTLWNTDSMHRKIRSEPESAIDAKVVELLWKNSMNAVIRASNLNAHEMLKEIADIQPDLVADAGAYFKDFSNLTVMQALSKHGIYYNAEGALETYVEDASVSRVTYLDQSHCIGSDIRQKKRACGVVTIGQHMLLRDLLQSVYRMRNLGRGQSVLFFLSADVAKLIQETTHSDTITFKEILAFVSANQARRQREDNVRALGTELKAYIGHLSLTHLAEIWIENTLLDPADSYGTLPRKVSREEYCENLMEKTKMQLRNIPGVDTAAAEKEIAEIVQRRLPLLPEHFSTSLLDSNEQTAMVQYTAQVETNVNRKVVSFEKINDAQFVEVEPGKDFICCDSWDEFSQKFPNVQQANRLFYGPGLAVNMKTFFARDERYKQVAEAFNDIYFERNMLEIRDEEPWNAELIRFSPNARPIKNAYFLHGKLVAVFPSNAYLKEIPGECITLLVDEINPPDLRLIKLKFLSGVPIFNKEELPLLRQWIKENNPKALRKFYEEHIICRMDASYPNYFKSNLYKIFSELVPD